MQALLGPRQCLVDGPPMARQAHSANRHGDCYRARLGGNDPVADCGVEALRRGVHVTLVAVHQDDAELVARITPDSVAVAKLSLDAPRRRGKDLIGRLEAISLVDRPEVVDGNDQEGDRGAEALGVIERLAERRQQVLAIEVAGEFVVARKEGEPLLALVTIVDDAHDAERAQGEMQGVETVGDAARARRPSAVVGVPAPGVLDDQPPLAPRAVGKQRVLDLVGNARPLVTGRAVEDGIVTAGQIGGIEKTRIAVPAGDTLSRLEAKDVGNVGAPADAIVADSPFVDNLANGGQNLFAGRRAFAGRAGGDDRRGDRGNFTCVVQEAFSRGIGSDAPLLLVAHPGAASLKEATKSIRRRSASRG